MENEPQYVWTIHITGGESFDMSFKTSLIEHNGKESISQATLTMSQKEELEEEFTQLGVNYLFYCPQRPEHANGIFSSDNLQELEEIVYPTEKCPECYFFQPEVMHKCGYKGWPKEAMANALLCIPKAQQDLNDCPIYPEE